MGAYDDFFKALAAVIEAFKEDHDTADYATGVHEPHEDNEVWCEIMHKGRPYGIYCTITRMGLE